MAVSSVSAAGTLNSPKHLVMMHNMQQFWVVAECCCDGARRAGPFPFAEWEGALGLSRYGKSWMPSLHVNYTTPHTAHTPPAASKQSHFSRECCPANAIDVLVKSKRTRLIDSGY
jgi:hypothetical protein